MYGTMSIIQYVGYCNHPILVHEVVHDMYRGILMILYMCREYKCGKLSHEEYILAIYSVRDEDFL